MIMLYQNLFYMEMCYEGTALCWQSTVKPVLSGHSKRRPKIGFKDRLVLNACQTYCRMHSAILLIFIKVPFVLRALFCLFLSGRLRQVLLYDDCGELVEEEL